MDGPIYKFKRTAMYISLTSSNNQISEFPIPNIYNEILFILFFDFFVKHIFLRHVWSRKKIK